MLYPFHWLLSVLASILRLGAGAGAPPITLKEPIIIYEFEGCPYCRIARDAISDSGVPVIMRPCPKGGQRFRPEMLQRGGKAQFPFMIDPNTNTDMYESADIAKYLRKNYGKKGRPLIAWLPPLNFFSSMFAVFARLTAGTMVQKSTPPEKPLELYGSERSPATRLVREKLCVMEIEYHWRSQPLGETQTPFLHDPNNGQEFTGAPAILRYLRKAYRG